MSRLRPKKALTVDGSTTVTEAARLMVAKRYDCALVTGEDGLLEGIITDTDITRRVVAEGLDLNKTAVSAVMTSRRH